MSLLALPSRPRLSEHACVRRHQVRGEDFWVLHDERSGVAYRLGPREWGLLRQADGTRDLDGIIAAASVEGIFANSSTLFGFLASLHDAGLLEEGVRPVPPQPEPSVARRIESLADYKLHCDGSGSCCRLYATVMLRPLEEATARSLSPRTLGGGDHPERLFAPMTGTGPCGASSVGFVHGRCAYLGPTGRCGLHAAGGSLGKPLGCRMFPAIFVDDGDSVRVSPAVECACVLASLRTPGQGETLIPQDVTSSDQLDEGIHITRLPAMILIAPRTYVRRDQLVPWSRAVADATPSENTIGVLLSLARAVQSDGLDPDAARRAMESPAPADLDVFRKSFAALVERARHRHQIDDSWRADDDLARHAVRWILHAAQLLMVDSQALSAVVEAPPSAVDTLSEAFYLRASAFGHQFVLGDAPLSVALADRAVRLALARALPLVLSVHERATEQALQYPLALVEATLRGHGLLSRGVLL